MAGYKHLLRRHLEDPFDYDQCNATPGPLGAAVAEGVKVELARTPIVDAVVMIANIVVVIFNVSGTSSLLWTSKNYALSASISVD